MVPSALAPMETRKPPRQPLIPHVARRCECACDRNVHRRVSDASRLTLSAAGTVDVSSGKAGIIHLPHRRGARTRPRWAPRPNALTAGEAKAGEQANVPLPFASVLRDTFVDAIAKEQTTGHADLKPTTG
jgi:hypothetical protein